MRAESCIWEQRPGRLGRAERGVTIMEVLISIFILLIGVVSIIAVFPATLRLSVTNHEITNAARAAASAVEELVASQVYAFPAGVAEAVESNSEGLGAVIPTGFGRGKDHEFPYYCLWDKNIPWRDLLSIVREREDKQGANSFILVKKNSPGDAERRTVAEIKTQADGNYALIRIDRGDPGSVMDPTNNKYLDKTKDWIWPVKEGARYWLGNFREDYEAGRFPAYARVRDVKADKEGKYNTLILEVVQESTEANAGTWDLATNWPDNVWRGFVLIHTGDRQEMIVDKSGIVLGAQPTERAAAAGGPFLITSNKSEAVTCGRADFRKSLFRKGDFVRIAGNAAGRVWWPEDFLGRGSAYVGGGSLEPTKGMYRTLPAGAGNEYSYACIFSGWENDIPNLYRVDIFVYRNFAGNVPPEENIPIARFGTMLAGR